MQPIEPEINIKVFIGYAHADQQLRKNLEDHLSALSYSGKMAHPQIDIGGEIPRAH